MKEILVSLLQKNRKNNFLKNKVEFRCKCGYSNKISYLDFFSGGDFRIGQPIPTLSPFISESVYDETINVTPLYLSRKCPVCGEEITAVFPLSLENLISILQSQPPDPQMYG
ncbi:MAG: hypothetical protein FIB08_08555 [Candidatus Methanoperedens sp.]|nr:hypothetical protein [Candidatus Methanoperedens sp.]